MFTIRMANLNIKIHNKYDYVKELCKDYLINEDKIDLEVSTNDEEIREEKSACNNEYSEEYCEATCIYRNICNKIVFNNRFFLHASVIEVDGQSYAFAANSGTGKSTHTFLWNEYFKKRARIINGDKPILEIKGGKLLAYGTPWCGKEGFNVNTSSPIKSICFIERSEKNELLKIDEVETIDRLIEQLEFPKDKENVEKLIDLLDWVIKNIPFYILKCNISQEAVEVAYSGMNKE